MTLTKEQILAAPDLKTVELEVPEWGGSVRVKQLSGVDRDSIQGMVLNSDGSKKEVVDVLSILKMALISRSIVDENGNRLFNDNEIEALGKKSGAALDRVYQAAETLNAVAGLESEAIAKN